MCDDFHGTVEWDVFINTMQKVFPDRPIIDIANDDPIFHSVFDLDEKYQVPGMQFTQTHQVYEKDGGGDIPDGAPFLTTTAASWSRSVTTWTWAIPGKTPTSLPIRRNSRRWESGWASITLLTPLPTKL